MTPNSQLEPCVWEASFRLPCSPHFSFSFAIGTRMAGGKASAPRGGFEKRLQALVRRLSRGDSLPEERLPGRKSVAGGNGFWSQQLPAAGCLSAAGLRGHPWPGPGPPAVPPD